MILSEHLFILDSVAYFLDNLHRISSPDYVPSLQVDFIESWNGIMDQESEFF